MACKSLPERKSLKYLKSLLSKNGQTETQIKGNKMFSQEILSRFFDNDRKTIVSFMLLDALLSKTDKIDAEGIKAAYEAFEPLAEKIANQYKIIQENEREKHQKDVFAKSTSIPMNAPKPVSPQMRIPNK